jgi:hypothetical protein
MRFIGGSLDGQSMTVLPGARSHRHPAPISGGSLGIEVYVRRTLSPFGTQADPRGRHWVDVMVLTTLSDDEALALWKGR